jgi:TPR repeat protein
MCIANARRLCTALNALLVLVMIAGSADAGPLEYLRDRYQDLFGPTQYEQADAAYKKGDYATAMKLWRPLADKGDNMAQWHLGVIYEQGLGVPQNYVEAVKWFRLAGETL